MGRQIMKIRITHILYSFGLGGLEGIIAELINRMDHEAFSHSICVFKDELASLEKINISGVDVHIVKRRFRHDPTTIIRLALVLKRIKPDIVRTYNWTGTDGIIAAKLCGIKSIIHSEHGFDIEEIYNQKKRRVLARRLLLRYCEKVIAVSGILKNWLLNDVRVNNDKIVYIPNGCDLKKFLPGKDMKRRELFGIWEGQVLIGAVGSLKKLKGHDILIRSFAELAKIYANIRLIIIGDGPESENLSALVKEMDVEGKDIFPGAVKETASFYRAMDIFVLPSLSENSPNTLLEAMASGLPIVATDVGDVRFMLDEGASGIIVEPGNVSQISCGIERYLKDTNLAKEKGENARSRVVNLFNIDNMVRAYEALYLNAVSK